jgi:4-alpha-glucanotransferase
MKIPNRASGILLHPTSLPGPHGIGDLGPDAYRFVDWLKSTGQSLWQWLPTTPIGPGDSPYQSVSAFAGSPLMVALEPLIEKKWLPAPDVIAQSFRANDVDFGHVVNFRNQALRRAKLGFDEQSLVADKNAFTAWCKDNAYWLEEYALFAALHQANGWRPWWEWDAALKKRDANALATARKTYADDIEFWKFVQWLFDTQCAALKKYANDRGVALVGDLPIFIADNSADCWSRQDLYFLGDDGKPSVVAGVPPDDFGPNGQRWGNPLYRWDRMKSEGYAWWISRVKRALTQCDLFRIDHFRGFAGYFEIPGANDHAREGRWLPGPGKALFDAIEGALGKVPVIAEDLGLITEDVTELRDSLGYPGMKILQFAFGGDGAHEFLPHNYTTNCIVYTGTHDNDTARGWFVSAPAHQQHFACTYLACSDYDFHWALIRAASNSVAKMAVFPLQDVLGLGNEARMNLPGSLGGSNWKWRFTWDMLGEEPARVLRLITAASGRAPIELIR